MEIFNSYRIQNGQQSALFTSTGLISGKLCSARYLDHYYKTNNYYKTKIEVPGEDAP